VERPVILVDTSVWIEYLRDTDDPVVTELSSLIDSGADLRMTEPIAMELLAGADNPRRDALISQLTNSFPTLPVEPLVDYRAAAQIFASVRRIGHPLRSLNDCLIAAIAVRTSTILFERDRDFQFISKVTPLALHRNST
jgi:predicted nucleic acid-binding protein